MKKIISFILLISFISIGFNSCEKSNDVIMRETSIKDFEFIGIQHNEGLEFVYNRLNMLVKETGSKIDQIDTETISDLINCSTKDYSKKIIKSSEQLEIALNVYEQTISLQRGFYENINKSNNNQFFLDSVINSLDLTLKQKDILSELSTIFKDYSLSYNESISAINLLTERVDGEIETDDEAIVLYIALSIGKHSYEYWNENLEEWLSLVENTPKSWFNSKDVVNDDIAGGISGGLVGALIGGTVSLGTLTVPSWIAGAVTGAVGTSSYNAIKQVLDHYL